jgi:hypothetical protein
LANEVASLPSGLHSEFPDLSVDWLATVFPDGLKASVRRSAAFPLNRKNLALGEHARLKGPVQNHTCLE